MLRFIYTTLILFLISVGTLASVKNLNPDEFYKMLKEKKAVILLDVRTPYEYEKDGHIPKANLIPIQVLPKFADRLIKFRNYPVLVYCRSGNRSLVAAKYLEKLGFKEVYNLRGGIIEWKKYGLPVEYGK